MHPSHFYAVTPVIILFSFIYFFILSTASVYSAHFFQNRQFSKKKFDLFLHDQKRHNHDLFSKQTYLVFNTVLYLVFSCKYAQLQKCISCFYEKQSLFTTIIDSNGSMCTSGEVTKIPNQGIYIG